MQFNIACIFNTLRLRQNGRHFPDNISKCIFLSANVLISIKISLKFVPMGPINNIPALVQIMACCRPGDKPLSEPMVVSLLTHRCVTWPQWVKVFYRWPCFQCGWIATQAGDVWMWMNDIFILLQTINHVKIKTVRLSDTYIREIHRSSVLDQWKQWRTHENPY